MQSLIKMLYPPQCVMCDTQTDVEFSLCGPCWRETPFVAGLCCDACGAPLPGEDYGSDGLLCDDCLVTARPWSRGRSVMVYKDKARRLVLGLKHGDRTDLVRAAGPWLARAGQPLLTPDTVILPIPLHRFRLIKRTFNQAALLAQAMARVTGHRVIPDGLTRTKRTAPLDGHTKEQRFEELVDAMHVTPRQASALAGRKVLLIDDVMTSGATFAAATEACHAAGADDVCVLALARVIKDA